ncbi:hypothetical protein IGI04_038789 [Brassica rapa subsp. trilocularis]|uniref:NADP-dependent oxidoreductase domain-containing protein n=1 Tax=Brassica rapa subsp. trilocularis TaxID=1813537 RepID=A0ABQ7LL72_BRACM|nr:hypothetical protein IGI04_038789 [Brassica rapa subsp. trilocularis]
MMQVEKIARLTTWFLKPFQGINSGITSDVYGPEINELLLGKVHIALVLRAHAVHPLTAVQLEWSFWSRDVEEDIIPTCRELGIGIGLPRFQQENLDHNKILYEKVNAMAEKKSCTPAQVALAWVHHQGDDVCPIPGTSKIKNLSQNIGALSVKLTAQEMAELEAM